MALGPDDVGARVVVRYRLAEPDPDSGATLTDVLGVLEHWSDSSLSVRLADGSAVHVDRVSVRAARVVPAAPPPRPS